MSRDPESIPTPRAGMEIVPLAALTRIPFPSCAALSRLRLLGEFTLGPLVVFAAYQTVLTALRTESSVRLGELNRGRQIQLILASLVQSSPDGVPSIFGLSLSMSLLRLLLPSLSLPLGLWGVLGVGRVSERLFNAFWDGLNPGQQAELRRRAFAAGVNLRFRLDGYQTTLEA